MNSRKRLTIIAQFIVLVIFSVLTTQAAGEVDPTFQASTAIYPGGIVFVVAGQPDGKMFVGGDFLVGNGFARHGIIRLNADGTTDTNFNPPNLIQPTGTGGSVRAIVVQPDGKVLVGGDFHIPGTNYFGFIRLNIDGTLDTSFAPNPDVSVRKIVILPDGSILANAYDSILKVNPNGTPFQGFNYQNGGSVVDFVVQPDQKFLVSRHNSVERRNPDGTLDNSFTSPNSSGAINRMLVQPDGKIVIAGGFSSINTIPHGRIARLNSNGTVDLTFNTGMVGASQDIEYIAAAPDGKFFIAGRFLTYNGTTRNHIAKLNSDGTLDTSFTYTPPQFTTITSIALLVNGQILLGRNVGGDTVADYAARLNADGSPDLTFSIKIGIPAKVYEVAQQADGKIYIVGRFPAANNVTRNSLARLNADGSLDTSFVPYFNNLPITQIIYAVVPQPDGKVIVGSHQGIILTRLNSDGSQDATFTMNLQASSIIHDIALLPDGKMLIAGSFAFPGDTVGGRAVARLNADGTRDVVFNVPFINGVVHRVLRQTDGKVLIGGTFTQVGVATRGRIARLNETNGSLDATFNPPGGANNTVYDFDLQSDGKVVLGGIFTMLNGSTNQIRTGRLNADGSLDSGFVQAVNGDVTAIKLQPDGKILIGGRFSVVAGVTRNGMARLNTNGTLDGTFYPSASAPVLEINLQADNKILVGGDFTMINNTSSVTVARLLNLAAAPQTLFDYEGDGKADVSIFRPSENTWYIYRSSDNGVVTRFYGANGYAPIPADYDGDGKTDHAVFRDGDWYYLSSVTLTEVFFHWGQAGDIPLPSDFNGDGTDDFIVYRPSNGVWYRFNTTGTTSIIAFGQAGDKPVRGDFDGDGKSDLAIFRPSTGDWWYLSSIDNSPKAVRWGISTDIPAPADYDGDGKTDFAVYRPSNGTWYIINSNNGSFTIFQFGIAEDKPVPADYDGDGKADIAVFRPSTGTWYQQKTTAGFAAQQFGIATDIPTENIFVP